MKQSLNEAKQTGLTAVPPPDSSEGVRGHKTPETISKKLNATISRHNDQQLYCRYRLVGLVVRRLPRERKIPGSNPACAGIFSGSSYTSDLKIGTPVASLPGAGVIGSALGLVGSVSVYCDWVR